MASSDPKTFRYDNGTRELTIEWADGHQSAYGFDWLRKICPCADCNGKRRELASGGLTLMTNVTRPGAFTLTELEGIGRYALCPHWSDGHSTGIFSFDFLRARCPCPDCRDPVAG
ncbi:MAG: gamma-butyrobetaine hydroxylase-like domain-containing protein [Candidatus Methylomirabilales bacterium]